MGSGAGTGLRSACWLPEDALLEEPAEEMCKCCGWGLLASPHCSITCGCSSRTCEAAGLRRALGTAFGCVATEHKTQMEKPPASFAPPQGKWAFGAAGLQHPKHTGALGADEASADLRAEPGWAAPTWPSRVPLGAPCAPCPPKGRVVRGHPREGCVCRGVPRSPPHLGTSWGTSRVPAEPCRTPPQRTAGGEPGGPREASLLKSGCCIYFPLLAARRGSPSQPLIVVSAS